MGTARVCGERIGVTTTGGAGGGTGAVSSSTAVKGEAAFAWPSDEMIVTLSESPSF